MKRQPLRYSISSWYDLDRCKSNNSSNYYITVEDIIDDDNLTGLVVSVRHTKYGTLFSHLLNSSGELITVSENDRPHEFDTKDILAELGKFGFDVRFTPQEHLSTSMLEYLETLQSLKYDKLRLISIVDASEYSEQITFVDYVVGFESNRLPKWLDNTYSPSKAEFIQALVEGSACNVSRSPEGKKLNWSWLDYIANISDILESNLGE